MWRSATTTLGELFVMMPLEPAMPMWFAGSLDSLAQVIKILVGGRGEGGSEWLVRV